MSDTTSTIEQSPTQTFFTRARKAVVSAVTAGGGAAVALVVAGVQASSEGGTELTSTEWSGIAGALVTVGLAAGYATWRTPNGTRRA